MESDQNLGFGEVSDVSGSKRVSEGSSGNSDTVNKKPRVTEKLDDDQEGKKEKEPVLKLESDLHVSIMKEEIGFGECNQIGLEFDLNGPPVREVIDISSDDEKVDEMLGKESTIDLDLRLGINDGNGGSSERRSYSREEKGKAKVDDLLSLSLPSEIPQGDVNPNMELNYIPFRLLAAVTWQYHAEKLKRERALRIKRVRNYELQFSRKDDSWNIKLENLTGSFSAELKAIIDRNTTQRAEQLIEWSAHSSHYRPRPAPSLLDLSLNVLAKNPDAVSSFEDVPDWLKRRIVNLLCDVHTMDIRILELLFEGSPTEIRVKNCSWMTEKQLVDMLKKSDLQNLRVLQLDSCGQCSFDDIICNSLALPPNSLACLGILSLRAAARLSDNTLRRLLVSAPLLQSINLGQCSLLTCDGIKILADSLKTNLKELYIDQCPRIDAMHSLSSMMQFEHLEVISVAEIPTVSDKFVMCITRACGRTLKELNLAGCVMLTDGSLQAIGHFCSDLCSLNISNLNYVTDLGLCYLADGCRSLESLNIARAGFSDVVVAAFLETSGGSLKELSLNHVRKVSFNSAFALAKFSRKLVSLDLSWCRQVTDEALGFITDNCSSLKLLKIFGCTQITDTFVLGRANSQVHVVGRDSVSVLDHVKMFEPVEVLLHYSPLETPAALAHNDGM
ncbi:F-box/LRR-repeat protein 2 isoform X2 [Cynara cardunculus var. scolymus]|nr:F-box/LRR-repeat protein 2 isoform X2 [Cynara cardunculus var. scolymus]XP_024959332.1 F-box/LRR-repeat protein 2 isoform X2 [Cynara cardunculus var. scolymus]